MDKFNKIFKGISDKFDADIVLYSGRIDRESADHIINITPIKKNVFFILCTFGGDPHAAYRIARALQDKYKHFTCTWVL